MPTTGPTRRRLTSALPALLLAACGGSSPAPATCDLPPTVTVGATEAYRLIGPADWPAGCSRLTVQAPAMATTERLGVVLVNAGGPDYTAPTLTVSGTATFADAGTGLVAASAAAPLAAVAAAPDLSLEAQAALDAGHAMAIDRRQAGLASWLAAQPAGPAAARVEAVAPACTTIPAAPAVGTTRSFCKDKLTGSRRIPVQLTATLVKASAHALFYVDNAVLPSVNALLTSQGRTTLWQDFADYYEGTNDGDRNAGLAKRILPSLTESFGPETHFDTVGCRTVFLFANLLEYLPAGGSGIIVGYFDPTDQQTADTVCTGAAGASNGTGSNGADMLFLLDPATFVSKGYTLPVVVDDQLPGTMAHELQHDVIFNARCNPTPSATCTLLDDPLGDLWLNEGLAMISEDLSGFGLATASERDRVGKYLNCARTGGTECYQDVSLTQWPTNTTGDPNGHYGGAHAFLRWHLDRAGGGCLPGTAGGCSLTRTLVGATSASRVAVAAATGLGFEEGVARFGVGAMFSGETALFTSYAGSLKPAPDLSYASGVPWSPLHTTTGRVRYTKLQPATPFTSQLRADGWGAYLSGKGTAGAPTATLTVDSTAGVKPRVAVVRLKGDLPP